MSDPQKTRIKQTEQLLPHRPQYAGILVSLLGWAVVAVPILTLSVLIFTIIMNPNHSLFTIGKFALGLAGTLLLFCMIAAPHLLGQAVVFRERGMWLAALVTGIPTIGAILFVVSRWLLNAWSA